MVLNRAKHYKWFTIHKIYSKMFSTSNAYIITTSKMFSTSNVNFVTTSKMFFTSNANIITTSKFSKLMEWCKVYKIEYLKNRTWYSHGKKSYIVPQTLHKIPYFSPNFLLCKFYGRVAQNPVETMRFHKLSTPEGHCFHKLPLFSGGNL